MNKYLFSDDPRLRHRDLSNLEADKAAVNAMVQAAVNVELFTIPLYMTSLYSVYGMHQINGDGNNFYQGRLWPGLTTTRKTDVPLTTNQDVFNKVFSVFIAEMLHLQLASNICTSVGYAPTFTSPLLQNPDHSWNCYGDDKTIIPHVIDLKDVKKDSEFYGLKVKLDSMNATQVKLFLAIEETENNAREMVDPEIWKKKYEPTVPYANWTSSSTEADLPLFGTIGKMYLCLWEYLSLEYTDGQNLWDKMYDPNSIQQDLFNSKPTSAQPQYPKMSVKVDQTVNKHPLLQVKDMINGITDQGEGHGVIAEIDRRLKLQMLKAVKGQFQPNEENIAVDYPSYSDVGVKLDTSADATARGGVNAGMDHFEIFQAVQKLIAKPDFLTWDMWHQKNKGWNAKDLIKNQADYETNLKNYPQLPTAEQIAAAMNNLTPSDPVTWQKNHDLFSQIATGSITGMTMVLDNYWKVTGTNFPMPAMSGTGDRMSICWALFGKAPDLSLAPPAKKDNTLYHACQGMALDPNTPVQEWGCASPTIYHTCIGSNGCRSEGGCGFVQSTAGGGSCGGSGCGGKALRGPMKAAQNLCGGPTPPATTYGAPADNKCGAFGGCAVPISASQMYPAPKGKMEFFDFVKDPQTGKWTSVPLPDQYAYQQGQLVHDVAWDAYTAVLKNRKQPVPEKPAPNDIRLAFPPST